MVGGHRPVRSIGEVFCSPLGSDFPCKKHWRGFCSPLGSDFALTKDKNVCLLLARLLTLLRHNQTLFEQPRGCLPNF